MDVLSEGELLLKRLTGTRWSAKYAAIRTIRSSYPKVRDLLISLLVEDSALSNEYKSAARGLLKTLIKLQTNFMLLLWDNVLSVIEKTSQFLHKSDLDLTAATTLLKLIFGHLEEFRNNSFAN